MDVRTIGSIIRRNLLLVFLVALFAGGGGFYWLLEDAAMDNAEQEARLVLSTAMAVRTYTNVNVLPQMNAIHDALFREETVPSFAAQTIFRNVGTHQIAYSYRESALNPTALSDRAEPFEVELIRLFRNDKNLVEKRGVLDSNAERLFYLARPIRIDDPACLVCHDTPARAPKTMLAKYGTENGFGWKLGQIIGVQLVTVPVTREFRNTLSLVVILVGGLAIIFAIAFFALNAALEQAVVTPLAHLADAAEKASRSESSDAPLPQSGAREIRLLSESIQRLRNSLARALEQIRGSEGTRE